MLRDGVCDDTSNNARCFYDGGDCCKENKDKALCRNCTCVLNIDISKLEAQLEQLEVRPVRDPGRLVTAIAKRDGSMVEVEDVVSLEVCSLLCLEHKRAYEINAWHYLVNEQVCLCGWVDSVNCPRKMALTFDDSINESSNLRAFIQLKKTVPCGRNIFIVYF